MEEVKNGEQKPEVQQPVIPPAVQERKPIKDLITLLMERTGQTREQATAWLSYLFQKLDIDPQRDLEEAMRMASSMATIIQMIPNVSEGFRERASDTIASHLISKVASKPDPDERIAKMMETVAPYMAIAPALREMARVMSVGQENSGKSAELAAVEERLKLIEERLREKPIEELKQQVAELKEHITRLKSEPKGSEEDKVVKAIKELREELAEKRKKEEHEEIKKQLESLENKLVAISQAPPQERKNLLKEMADEISATTSGLKALKDSLMELGLVKEEEITTKSGRVNWGAVINRALKIAESYAKSPPQRQQVITAQPAETFTAPVSQQAGATTSTVPLTREDETATSTASQPQETQEAKAQEQPSGESKPSE